MVFLKKQIRRFLNRDQNENQTQQLAQGFCKEVCENSTVHGIRYFTERGLHWTERIWWVFAFGVSIWLCGSSIGTMWLEWRENPAETLTENPMPISAIPFPTLTICPETKAYASKLMVTYVPNIFHQEPSIRNMSDIELKRLKSIWQLCGMRNGDDIYGKTATEFADESIYDTIADFALKHADVIDYCDWIDIYKVCGADFSSSVTDEGICYSLNALNSHEIYTDEMAPELMIAIKNPNSSAWSFENGYDDDAKMDSYPQRLFNAGLDTGLEIFLPKKDSNNICLFRQPGFRFYLNSPGEVQIMSRRYLHVSPDEELQITVKPTLITTSQGLRSYDPNKRQCFFNSDHRLRFFKIYAQSNCEVECLANFTLLSCGCVKFSMPRDKRTKICGTANIECYLLAKRKIFGADVIDGLEDEEAKAFRKNCNCLPSCTSIKYEVDIDRGKLPGYDDTDTATQSERSIVRIFYDDHLVNTLKRSEALTFSGFLSMCGGLLGLFLGISALSIIELIYYATLHLFWQIRQRKLKNVVLPFQQRDINRISLWTSTRR